MKKNKKIAKITMIISAALLTVPLLYGCRKKSISVSGAGNVSIPVPTSVSLPTDANTAFKPIRIQRIGNHTYCIDDLSEYRTNMNSSQKKHLRECLEEADKSLKEDVYVYSVGEAEMMGEYRLFGQKYQDGVVMDKVYFNAGQDDTNTYIWYQNDLTVPIPSFDKTGLMDPADLDDEVYDLAKQHEKEMFDNRSTEPIRGEYILCVDLNGTLYYDYRINEYSYVLVDAISGQVIRQSFWDGVYVD